MYREQIYYGALKHMSIASNYLATPVNVAINLLRSRSYAEEWLAEGGNILRVTGGKGFVKHIVVDGPVAKHCVECKFCLLFVPPKASDLVERRLNPYG